MENNEIMINEEIEAMDDHIVADDGASVGTGVAMLIGAGLAVAVGAVVKLGKKAYVAYKAKKELRKPDKEILVEPDEIEDVATA